MFDVLAKQDAPISGSFAFPWLPLASYRMIKVYLANIHSATNATDLYLTFYIGGVEIASGYRWTAECFTSSASASQTASDSDTKINITGSAANFDMKNGAEDQLVGNITLSNPGSGAIYKKCYYQVSLFSPTSVTLSTVGAGSLDNAGAVHGLKISGQNNLDTGHIRVVGIH